MKEDKIEYELSGLNTDELFDRGVMEYFFHSVTKGRKIINDEKLTVSGSIQQFERFYQLLKRLEFYKNNSIDF